MIVRLATNAATAVDTGAQCIGQVEAVRVRLRLTGYSGDINGLPGRKPRLR